MIHVIQSMEVNSTKMCLKQGGNHINLGEISHHISSWRKVSFTIL